MGKEIRAFCWHQEFVSKGLSALPRGYLYIYKIIKNVYKIKFLFLNLQWMGKMIRAFCWHQKFVPKGLYALGQGLYIYMYKIVRNVYKIRIRRDHFEACYIWAKRKGLSVVIKILSPVCCLPLPGAIYMWKNMYKIRLQRDCFKTCNKWAKW